MNRRIALLSLAALALPGCDAAAPGIDGTLRVALVEQCTQMSESAGIAAGAVNSVCECTADKWLEKPLAERAQIDPAAIEGIIRTCVGTAGTSPAPATAETQ